MAVVAKFKVYSVAEYADQGREIKLQPVTSGSEENKQFFRYTPGGEIRLLTVNDSAAQQFEVGSEMYVTFEKAPKAQ